MIVVSIMSLLFSVLMTIGLCIDLSNRGNRKTDIIVYIITALFIICNIICAITTM